MESVSLPAVDTAGAAPGDWLIIRALVEPDRLNPVLLFTAQGRIISEYLYDYLNNVDNVTNELKPNLAGLPEISPDHLAYTYTLDKNARWSDGRPLTGEDVIFTMKATQSPFVDAANNRNAYTSVKTVELVNNDPYKVKFTLSEPYFRSDFTLGQIAVIPKHIYDPENFTDKLSWENILDPVKAAAEPLNRKLADIMNAQQSSRDPSFVIASGPYMLESWIPGQSVTIKRNPAYWRASDIPAYPSKLIFKFIQDNVTAIVSAKNKEIDFAPVNPAEFFNELPDPSKFNIASCSSFGMSYEYIGWNYANPLFKDAKIRWALSQLVDRKSLINKVLYGQAVPIQSHITYTDKKLLNSDLKEITYAPDKAKQILTEAGWKDSDGDGILDKIIDGKKTDFKFTILFNNSPVRKKILLIYIDALKSAGIIAEMQGMEIAVLSQRIRHHEFDAVIAGWSLGNLPADPYAIFHSTQSESNGSNFVSYKNPASDDLIDKYRFEFDEAKRIDLIKKWQQIIYDDQPYTFLWSNLTLYIYDKRLRNVRCYPIYSGAQYNEIWVPAQMQRYK